MITQFHESSGKTKEHKNRYRTRVRLANQHDIPESQKYDYQKYMKIGAFRIIFNHV